MNNKPDYGYYKSLNGDVKQVEGLDFTPLSSLFIDPKREPNRYTFDDMGLGYLFADTFIDSLRYVPESKEWYHFNGRIWQRDTDNLNVQEAAKKLANYLFTLATSDPTLASSPYFVECVNRVRDVCGRTTIINEARTVWPMKTEEFDSNPLYLNCANGTYNFACDRLLTHKAGFYATRMSNVSFDKSASCELWESMVIEAMCGDQLLTRNLQKVLGYCLTGDISYGSIFVLDGSRIARIISRVILKLLGTYGCVSSVNIKNNRALGNHMLLSNSMRLIAINNMSQIKNLNPEFAEQFISDTQTQPKLLLSASSPHDYNELINSGHTRPIPVMRDPRDLNSGTLYKKFLQDKESLSGILNWCICGYKMLLEEGLEEQSMAVRAERTNQTSSDHINLFLKQCILPSTNKLKTNELYTAYINWSLDIGRDYLGQRKFVDAIRKIGILKRGGQIGHYIRGDIAYSNMN